MLFQKFTCSIYLMKRKEETILHLTVTDLSCSLKHYGYNLSSVCSDSSTLSHWWSRTNQKPRIERLSECGLDCVDEDHCVRDAEEGQSSCSVIHKHSYSADIIIIIIKHSYSAADGLHRETSLYIIVSEWVTGARADQTPGLIIISKQTLITVSLLPDALIWHWYKHISTPLQLPVTASTHTLSTQHLMIIIKSVWMIRIRLICVSVSNHSVSLRQTEAFIHCVQIQRELIGIWWR